METLNLIEKLKGCPEGTPLYSPLFGQVELVNVCSPGFCYTIEVKATERNGDTDIKRFTADGRYWDIYENDECLLFPSKDCRDWSQFVPPEPEPEHEQKNEPVYKQLKENILYWFKHIAQIADERKTANGVVMEDWAALDEIKALATNSVYYIQNHFILHEGNEYLKDTMDEPEPKPMHDFKPFDKVLVRDYDGEPWRIAFFDYKGEGNYPFHAIGVANDSYKYCVPYEGNEHLKDTTETLQG